MRSYYKKVYQHVRNKTEKRMREWLPGEIAIVLGAIPTAVWLTGDWWLAPVGLVGGVGAITFSLMARHLVRAPYELDEKQTQAVEEEKAKVDALEEARKPKLSVTAIRKKHHLQKNGIVGLRTQ